MRSAVSVFLCFWLALCCGEQASGAESPSDFRAVVVAGPQSSTLGGLTLYVPFGMAAYAKDGGIAIGEKKDLALVSVQIASMEGLTASAFAERLTATYPGAQMMKWWNAEVFCLSPPQNGGAPDSVWLTMWENTALILRFYDDGPVGADLLKTARADTEELQNMLDSIILSPDEVKEKALSRGNK